MTAFPSRLKSSVDPRSRVALGLLGKLAAIAILVLVVLIVWVGAVAPLLDYYVDNERLLGERVALADRMAAVAATLPALQTQARILHDRTPPQSMLLTGASDALAAAQLQEKLERVSTSTGVLVQSTESVPPQDVGAVRRIGLRLNLSGKYAALIKFLAGMDAAAPPMFVEALQIQAQPITAPADDDLAFNMTVYGYRAPDTAP